MSISLDQAVKSYVILLDTSFAMSEAFKHFVEKYETELKRNPIKVPTVVVGELEHRAKRPHPTNPDAQELARKAVGRINKAAAKGIIESVGDKFDAQTPKQHGTADGVIFSRVSQILMRKNVLVLTRDRGLASQLQSLAQHQNYAVKDLMIVGHIASHTKPSRPAAKTSGFSVTSPPRPTYTNPLQPAGNPFKVSVKIEPNLDNRITIREELREGSSLKTESGQSVILGKKLAEGGEGSVYEIKDSPFVCKIYHTTANNYHLTEGRKRKIELMLTRTISDALICYPRSAVCDSTGTFRGFTMPKATGEPLGRGLFHPSFVKTHPQWNRKHSTQLALTILRKIEKLHLLNILIGDINPLNILVKDENTVYFVDCDSYQVEGFPCPVGTPAFTAPDIQGRDFKTLLRTKEHELFAVATLLFMIFMPGQNPYACVGGEGVAQNIKAGHFPYPFGEKGSDRIPEGPCKYAWSHLSYKIKKAFTQCFYITERNNKQLVVDEDKNITIPLYAGRIGVSDWIGIIHGYGIILKHDGYFGDQIQAGYDLAIRPENRRRIEKNGEITPPIRPDGKTDMQADREKLVAEMLVESTSSPPTAPRPQPVSEPPVHGSAPKVPYSTTYRPSTSPPSNPPPPPPPPKTLGQMLWDWCFN